MDPAPLWAALAQVQDPEMPVSLVDLGLIYRLSAAAGCVTVDLTFTAMGCPAAEMIMQDIRDQLLLQPGVNEVHINVVWDPPWTSALMTAEGRDSLALWGLAV